MASMQHGFIIFYGHEKANPECTMCGKFQMRQCVVACRCLHYQVLINWILNTSPLLNFVHLLES
jgi:hypothetical protein